LEEASNTIASAETRTRMMGRALKQVEALPEGQVQSLLPQDGASAGDEEAST
jgi:DNA recombination protein RmuC